MLTKSEHLSIAWCHNSNSRCIHSTGNLPLKAHVLTGRSLRDIMPVFSDQELVERVCQQDSQAFDLLSDRYRDLIFRYLCSMLHDRDISEDIVQEVFLRLWLRAQQWQGRGQLKVWLLRIATNLALNHLRSCRRHPQQPLEIAYQDNDEELDYSVPAWLIDNNTRAPDQVLEELERGQLLRQLINGLPANKKEVFRLIHDEELEIRQVAANLAIPEGTVKSRLHYANKWLAREWRTLEKTWEENI